MRAPLRLGMALGALLAGGLLLLSGAVRNTGQDSATGALVALDPLPESSGGFGASVSALGSGILVRLGASSWVPRTLVAGTNVTITNPDGVAGNPVVSAVLQAGSLVYHTVSGNANGGLNLGGTCFLTSPGVACSGAEIVLGIADRAGTARNLRCRAVVGPGLGRTSTFTVRQNGVSTAMTCPMSGATATCDDLVHTFAVAAGDQFSMSDGEQLLSGTTRPVCSFVVTN